MKKINLKHAIAFSVIIFISACGGAGGGNQAAAQMTSPTTTNGVANAILAAESSGKLPVLNRDNTLLGVDADGNGVRDDIDAYINALPDTPEQKKALRQSYKSTVAALTVDINDKAAVDKVSQMETDAIHCSYLVYGIDFDHDLDRINKRTLNTRARYLTYFKYNSALNGSVATLPTEDTCEK